MKNSNPADCQQCIWGDGNRQTTHCSTEAEGSCTLKCLIERGNVRHGQLTTAHFNGYSLTTALQPIYSLSHERPIAYEALLRGKEGEALISPREIFSSVTNFEQTVQLDRLCRAIHLHNYQRHISGEAWLFLNINPQVVIGGRNYGSFFQELLDSTGIAPERIVIEILEHAIDDEHLLAETVHYYREMGCLIALDDFGSGHSNFDRILRLQPDIIKLDSHMIRQAGNNLIARRIMPNLIAMLHEAGCLVLMEGVETEEEALIALECNVDFVQGFYFADPQKPHHMQSDRSELFNHLNELFKLRFDQLNCQREQELLLYKKRFAQSAAFYANGIELEIASKQLVTMPRVQRCYVLDEQGSQLGDNLYPHKTYALQSKRFAPLSDTQGANWNRKPYFRNAIADPGRVKITRPYLSVIGTDMCVTLSICIEVNEELRVLCCDLQYQDQQQSNIS